MPSNWRTLVTDGSSLAIAAWKKSSMADVKRSISDSPMVVSLWKDVPAGAKRAQAGAFERAASQQGRVATEQVHRRYF